MGPRRNQPAVFLAALIASAVLPAYAQTGDEPDLDAGVVLVADRQLKDPNFAEAVILVVHYDDDGTMGIILNRPAKLSVAQALETWKEAKGREEPVYVGGPVEKAAVLALTKSRVRVEKATHIFADVHLISERLQLQRSLSAGVTPDKLRIYAGYAGWAAEQLENEIEIGAWHILPGDARIVFDTDPESLWSRLIKKTETQIAILKSPAYR